MVMDILGLGKDCSKLWGGCDDDGTSEHLWNISCTFRNALRVLTHLVS